MKKFYARMFRVFACAIALCAAGCSHTIKYKLSEKDKWTGPPRKEVVRVETFQENGAVPKEKEVLVGDKRCRTNGRERYNKEVAVAVSDMLARHLAHSGLFTKVVRDPSQPADLVLSGVISNYTAVGVVNETAEAVQTASAGMGLIGAIIGSISTAGMKTEIKANVELNPVTLRDSSGNVVWQGATSVSTNFSAHFDRANSGAIYNYPDTLLKAAVNELIRKLGQTPAVRRE